MVQLFPYGWLKPQNGEILREVLCPNITARDLTCYTKPELTCTLVLNLLPSHTCTRQPLVSTRGAVPFCAVQSISIYSCVSRARIENKYVIDGRKTQLQSLTTTAIMVKDAHPHPRCCYQVLYSNMIAAANCSYYYWVNNHREKAFLRKCAIFLCSRARQE